MKKALIFSPYLDSLGGGEVYTLHFAKALEQADYQIEIAWKSKKILKLAHKRFGIDVSEFKINKTAYKQFSLNSSVVSKYFLTKNYDLTFFLSDGSLPFLFSKKNIVHFQVPFPNLKSNFINKFKLKNLNIVCNSKFTKKIIDQNLNLNSQVLYPPAQMFEAGPKQNLILSVGRFTNTLQNKRQDILISAFKNLVDQGLTDWKLVLVGNTTQAEAKSLIEELKFSAKGYPIKFKTDINFRTLKKLYAKASIYWHASGYDINPQKQPHLVEHFGISTVEAMSAGAVPVVINKGGQVEIVTHNQNGFLFDFEKDLINLTQLLIKNNALKNKLAARAVDTSKEFSSQIFYNTIKSKLL